MDNYLWKPSEHCAIFPSLFRISCLGKTFYLAVRELKGNWYRITPTMVRICWEVLKAPLWIEAGGFPPIPSLVRSRWRTSSCGCESSTPEAVVESPTRALFSMFWSMRNGELKLGILECWCADPHYASAVFSSSTCTPVVWIIAHWTNLERQTSTYCI